MTTQELIASYRAAAESTPGLTLENIDAYLAAHRWPQERFVAVTALRAEVKAVLDEQALAQWLIDNSIPEWQYDGYYMENDEVKFDPNRLIEVEPEPEPEPEPEGV